MLSCTIIVGEASAWMSAYHERMPVILEPKDFEGWLDRSLGTEAGPNEPRSLGTRLRPASESMLRSWPVSPRLNRTGAGDDDPSIIEPVSAVA